MLFTSIRPALLTLIQQIAGEGVLVHWKEQPASYMPPGTKTVCKLSIGPSGSKGWDERRIDYDASRPLGAECVEQITGVRYFTLKILCECLLQTDDSTAPNYLETIRTRLGFSSSSAILKTVNVSLTGDSDLQDLTRTIDNRPASIANLDIKIAATANERDPANPFGYIETVEEPAGTVTYS